MPGRVVINSGGFGAVPQTCTDLFGVPVPMDAFDIAVCSGWEYWLVEGCWCMAQSAWQQLAAIPPVPAPTAGPSVPDYALTNPNQAGADTTGADSQAASNAQITQNQQQTATWAASDDLPSDPAGGALDACESFTQNWPAPLDALNCTTVIYIGLAAIGAWLFFGRK